MEEITKEESGMKDYSVFHEETSYSRLTCA